MADSASMHPNMIGKGTYGCVYSPPLRCVGQQEREEGVVSKLMLASDAVSELKAFERLQINQVDPEEEFSINSPTSCAINPDDYTHFKQCPNYKHGKNVPEQFKLLLYKAGGIDMNTMILDKEKGSDPKEILEIMQRLENVFYGLAVMNRNNLYHIDVKPQNIVCQPGGCRLIDFGISCHIDPVTNKVTMGEDDQSADKAKTVYSNGIRYIFWPYETVMLNNGHLIGNKEEIRRVLKEVLPKFIKPYNSHYASIERKLVRHFYPKFYTMDSITAFIYPSEAAEKLAKLSLVEIADKIDVYSLGITIIILCGKLIEFWGSPAQVLAGKLINPDFTQRPTAEQAYMEYVHIMNRQYNIPIEVKNLDRSIKGKGQSAVPSEQQKQYRERFPSGAGAGSGAVVQQQEQEQDPVFPAGNPYQQYE